MKEIGGRSCKNLDFLLDEPPEQTANELNKHLASIVQTFPPLSENQLIPETPKDKIPEISAKQIIEKIQKLKKTSICPIDIPIDLIKAFPDKLSTPLVSIFNDISNSGCYPSCWKLGYITPIQKKGGVNDFTGVQLITLNPVFF